MYLTIYVYMYACPTVSFRQVISAVVCITVNIPVGYLTAFWNLPHITWVATDPTLADKSVFNTLIRTMGPFNKVGMFLVQFFRIFKWKRAGMYSGTSGKYELTGDVVRYLKSLRNRLI